MDGLAKLFKCPATWNSLSVLEKRDAVTEYLPIFFDQSPSTCKTVTDTTMAKMLEVFDNSDVLSLILNLPDSRQTLRKLLKMLLELLPPISTSNGKLKMYSKYIYSLEIFFLFTCVFFTLNPINT